MAVTAGQFTISFDKVNGVFILTDTTDYTGQSKPLTDVVGNFKITSPAGDVVHINTSTGTPDIDADVSLVNNVIVLPLDSNGEVLCGGYVFEYTITDLSDNSTITVITSIIFNYKSPEVELSMPYDCAKPELKSEDKTNYLVSGVLPTTITYDHNLYYPPTSGATTINSAANVIVTNTFYTLKNVGLQHSSDLTVDLTYDFPTYSVVDQITGTEFVNVICDPGLCDLFCGLLSLWNKYIENKGSKCGSDYLEKFTRLTSATSLIRQAYSCGKTNEVPAIIAEIKKQGSFADECCCDDDSEAPVLVTGVGDVFDIVLQQGTGIVVTSTVAGAITTYTVALDAATQAAINNAGVTVVAAGLGTTITPVTVGSTTTYTVAVTYALTDNVIPVYNSTSQVLEDSTLSTDGTTLSNTGDVSFAKDANVSLIQGTLANGDVPVGNILETKDGSYSHRSFNGEYTVSGHKGSGFDVVNGVTLEGYRRLYEDGSGNILLADVLINGSNIYAKSAGVNSSSELVTNGADSSSVSITPAGLQISTDSFIVSDSSTPAGTIVSNISNSLKITKEAIDYSFTLGFGASSADRTNTVVGSGATGLGSESTVIGFGASDNSNQSCIIIGSGSTALGDETVVIGDQTAGAANSVAVGFSNIIGGDLSFVLGRENTTVFSRSIIMGSFIQNNPGSSITLGFGTSAANKLVNNDASSIKVGFGDSINDTVLHVGVSKAQNYLGGSGTFEFSNNFSELAQNSKWNFYDGDVEVVNTSSGFIVKSPNGTRWRMTVDNAGAISIAAA